MGFGVNDLLHHLTLHRPGLLLQPTRHFLGILLDTVMLGLNSPTVGMICYPGCLGASVGVLDCPFASVVGGLD